MKVSMETGIVADKPRVSDARDVVVHIDTDGESDESSADELPRIRGTESHTHSESWRMNIAEFISRKQRTDSEEWRRMPSRVKEFYRRQNALIDRFVENEALHGLRDAGPSVVFMSPTSPVSGRASVSAHLGDLVPPSPAVSSTALLAGRAGQSFAYDAVPVDRVDERSMPANQKGARANERKQRVGSPLSTDDAAERDRRRALALTRASFALNVLLFVCKITATALSGSLSVISSLVDSSLDLFTGTVMWVVSRKMRSVNRLEYPGGRSRLEPIAVIACAAVMATAAAQLVSEGVRDIIAGGREIDLSPPTLALVGFTVVAKLAMFVLCRSSKNVLVRTLALDHGNDVVSNVVALVCGFVGAHVWWPADPMGAILVGLFILWNWARAGLRTASDVSGAAADPHFLQEITFLACNHDRRVTKIDTVRAYRSGSGYTAEVDIVLPADISLREAHDVGERLQRKYEHMPEIERAYVHVDYEDAHAPSQEHLDPERNNSP